MNLPPKCHLKIFHWTHSFIYQLDPPVYRNPIFILPAGWKWRLPWLTSPQALRNKGRVFPELHIYLFIYFSWAAHLNQSPESKWFNALTKVQLFVCFYVCLLCSHYMWRSHASPPNTHAVERRKSLLSTNLANNEKFFPRRLGTDWSQTISFSPWAHCFPPVPPRSRNSCNKTTFWSSPSSHPYPFVFLSGWRKEKTLAKLPWCIISKHLLMKVQAKQSFLLKERKAEMERRKIMMEKTLNEWNKVAQRKGNWAKTLLIGCNWNALIQEA